MTEPIHELGQNTELDEDANGDTVLRNTANGTSVKLANFIDIVGGSLGDTGDRVPGTSYFENIDVGELDADTLGADTLTAAVVVARPERLPIAALEAGESYEIPVRVADGETLHVHRWGAYDVSDGSVPTGLDVELVDGSDTVQAAENTANTQDASAPVASYQNSSGSVSIFKVRTANDTGSAIESPGIGAHFGYVVV